MNGRIQALRALIGHYAWPYRSYGVRGKPRKGFHTRWGVSVLLGSKPINLHPWHILGILTPARLLGIVTSRAIDGSGASDYFYYVHLGAGFRWAFVTIGYHNTRRRKGKA